MRVFAEISRSAMGEITRRVSCRRAGYGQLRSAETCLRSCRRTAGLTSAPPQELMRPGEKTHCEPAEATELRSLSAGCWRKSHRRTSILPTRSGLSSLERIGPQRAQLPSWVHRATVPSHGFDSVQTPTIRYALPGPFLDLCRSLLPGPIVRTWRSRGNRAGGPN